MGKCRKPIITTAASTNIVVKTQLLKHSNQVTVKHISNDVACIFLTIMELIQIHIIKTHSNGKYVLLQLHFKRYVLQLQALGKTILSFNYCLRFICELLSQWQNNKYLNSPYVAVLHHNRITPLCTLWTTPSVTNAKI